MTVLDWPRLPPADPEALRAGLRRLLRAVMVNELYVEDDIDDLFARTVGALLALLDSHGSQRDVVETVHQFLNQPLTLLWYHLHRRAGDDMHIDDVAIWTVNSPYLNREEHAERPWSRFFDAP